MINYWFARTTSTYNSWHPRGYVEADFTVRYDISLSGDWATLEINGAISLVAEREFLNEYDILSAVTADFDVRYSVSPAAREGSGTPSLPLVTASGSGARTIHELSGAPSLPLLTATGAGVKARSGIGTPSLPLVISVAGGYINPPARTYGNGTAPLPLVTASGVGKRELKATGTSSLLLLASAGAGTYGPGTTEVYRDFSVLWQAAGVVITDFPVSYSIFQDTASPGWTAEPSETEEWADTDSVTNSWSPVTQPTTTWN